VIDDLELALANKHNIIKCYFTVWYCHFQFFFLH